MPNEPVQGVLVSSISLNDQVHLFIAPIGASGRAYLTPEVLARPNLTVAVHTTVEKILFSNKGASLRATGVQLATSPNAPKFRVAATKDVILCRGVLGSTQLLLLSGVGPKEELEKTDVKCVKDLKNVGKHLIDVRVFTSSLRGLFLKEFNLCLAPNIWADDFQSQARV